MACRFRVPKTRLRPTVLQIKGPPATACVSQALQSCVTGREQLRHLQPSPFMKINNFNVTLLQTNEKPTKTMSLSKTGGLGATYTLDILGALNCCDALNEFSRSAARASVLFAGQELEFLSKSLQQRPV